MYFRFDRRHLEFLSNIDVYYHWQRLSWVHPTKTWHTTLYYSAISRISVLFIRTTILLIFDEFRQWKLLIWLHAYWDHVMLRSWNRCCPVENLFLHKVIKHFCHISSDKKVTQQSVLWSVFPLFATQGLTIRLHNSVSSVCHLNGLWTSLHCIPSTPSASTPQVNIAYWA